MKGPLFYSYRPPTLAGSEGLKLLDATLTSESFLSLDVAPNASGLARMRRVADYALAAGMAVIDPEQTEGAEPGQGCLPHVIAAAMVAGRPGFPDALPDADRLMALYAEQRNGLSIALTVHLNARLRPLRATAGDDVADIFLNETHAALMVAAIDFFLPTPTRQPLVSAMMDVFAAGGIPCGWFGSDFDGPTCMPSEALAYLAR